MKLVKICILLFVASCGDGDLVEADRLPKVTVLFQNQSQYTVESLFIHSEPLNYNETDSIISSSIDPGGVIWDGIPSRSWYVTVFRKPNQDSSVLAYTTATAWNPETHPRIIYFDEQFRVSTNLTD